MIKRIKSLLINQILKWKKSYNINFTSFSTTRTLLYNLTDPASPILIVREIVNFNNDLIFFIVVMSIFVVWVFIWGVHFYFTGLKYNTFIEIAWTVIPALVLMIIAVPSFFLLYSNEEFVEPSNDEPVLLNTVTEFELTPVKSVGLLETVDTVDGEEEKLLKKLNDAAFREKVLLGCLLTVAVGLIGWGLYPYLADYFNGSSSAPDSSSSSGSSSPPDSSSSSGSSSPPDSPRSSGSVFNDFDHWYCKTSAEKRRLVQAAYDYWIDQGLPAKEVVTKALAYAKILESYSGR